MIRRIFFAILFRIMPRKAKRKVMNEAILPIMLDSPQKDEFISNVLKFVEERYDPKAGQSYKNTEEEIEELLEAFPPLALYKVYLLHTVRNCRVKYELPV